MEGKLSWKDVFTDFCKVYPHLCKKVTYWCPHNYLEIEVWLDTKEKMIYSYEEHTAKFI